MKPKVNPNRKTKTIIIGGGIDFEVDLYQLQGIIDDLKDKTKVLEEKYEFAVKPYIAGEYYGYDGGCDFNLKVGVYTETEEEWKQRVSEEKKAVSAWNDARLQRLKDEIAELEKESGNDVK